MTEPNPDHEARLGDRKPKPMTPEKIERRDALRIEKLGEAKAKAIDKLGHPSR